MPKRVESTGTKIKRRRTKGLCIRVLSARELKKVGRQDDISVGCLVCAAVPVRKKRKIVPQVLPID